MFLKAVPEKQTLHLLSWRIVVFPRGTLSCMGHGGFPPPGKPASEGIFGGRSRTVGNPKPLTLGCSPRTALGDAGRLSPWHSQWGMASATLRVSPLQMSSAGATTMSHIGISVLPTQTDSISLLRHMKYLGEINQLLTTGKLPSWLLRRHSSVWLHDIYTLCNSMDLWQLTLLLPLPSISLAPLSSSSFSYWYFLNHPSLFYFLCLSYFGFR